MEPQVLYCLQDYRRRFRAITQNIGLLSVHANAFEYGCTCGVLSSTGTSIYHVKLIVGNEFPCCTCTCPDFQHRGRYCKHIYWVGFTFLGAMDPREWNNIVIDDFVRRYVGVDIHHKGRNETCPICLEDIDYKTQFSVCCKQSCQNAVHASCWNKYLEVKVPPSPQCVMCRHQLSFWGHNRV